MKKSNHHHSLPSIYLCPNWPGYWEQVHGLRNLPNWVDFSCHKKRPPDGMSSRALFDTGFFRFDMTNMTNLREEVAYKIVGRDVTAQKQFAQQVRKLKSGEIDYFFVLEPGHRMNAGGYVIGQIPEGRILLVWKPRERHASIFVREERPLMPDIMREWMEKLSPTLFGYSANCFIPRNQWWSKGKTKKFFGYEDSEP